MVVRFAALLLLCGLAWTETIKAEDNSASPGGGEIITDHEAQIGLARSFAQTFEGESKAKELYAALVTEYPERTDLRGEYATLLIKQRQYEAAVEQLELLLRTDPQAVAKRQLLARVYFWLGELGKSAGTISRLPESTIAKNAELLKIRGLHSWSEDNLPAALKDMLNGLAVAKTSTAKGELYSYLGQIHLSRGDYDRAVEFLERAIELERTDYKTKNEYALALSWQGDYDSAAKLFRETTDYTTAERHYALAHARVERKLNNFDKAWEMYQTLLKRYPNHEELISEFAELAAHLGRYDAAKTYINRAFAKSSAQKDAVGIAYLVSSWGDYYYAEDLLKQADPSRSSPEVTAALAQLYLIMDRELAAEELLRSPLFSTQEHKPYAAVPLAGLMTRRGRFQDARTLLQRALSNAADTQMKHQLCSSLLNTAYAESCQVDAELLRACIYQGICSLGENPKIGTTCSTQADLEKTLTTCRDISHLPENLDSAGTEARRSVPEVFYTKMLSSENSDCFHTTADSSPQRLTELGNLFRQHNSLDKALVCYKRALDISPFYLPAELGRTTTLIQQERHDEAKPYLRDLTERFPQNRAATLQYARVLSWSGDLPQSIALYENLVKQAESDALVAREYAQVLNWNGEKAEAIRAYSPVRLQSTSKTKAVAVPARNQERASPKPDIFQEQGSRDVQANTLPTQHAFHLSDARRAAYEKKYYKAVEGYSKALEILPTDTTSALECAQAACAQGLPGVARRLYQNSLQVSPDSAVVTRALERLDREREPSLGVRYAMWNEEGRGELSQIRRHRFEALSRFAYSDSGEVTLDALRFRESPNLGDEDFSATGFRLGTAHQLTEHLLGNASWQFKSYEDDLEDTHTGHLLLRYTFEDSTAIGVAYRRANEIQNLFGLTNDIQSDAGIISVARSFGRTFTLSGEAEYRNYDDNNALQRYLVLPQLEFDASPGVITVGFNAEYRDMRRDSIFVTEPSGSLSTIIHPYWTPHEFFLGSLSVGWTHYLDDKPFCTTPRNRYSVILSAKNDSQNNPGYQADATWDYELFSSLYLELRGMIHRSELWDAEAATASLMLRL